MRRSVIAMLTRGGAHPSPDRKQRRGAEELIREGVEEANGQDWIPWSESALRVRYRAGATELWRREPGA